MAALSRKGFARAARRICGARRFRAGAAFQKCVHLKENTMNDPLQAHPGQFHDAARRRALELREQAIAQMWQDALRAARRAMRGLLRPAPRPQGLQLPC
jgi:hypothetical protein